MADPVGSDFDAKTLLNDHGKDISGLAEKVGKCYSEDRFQTFQKDVKTIVLEILGHDDGKAKMKEWTEGIADKAVETYKKSNKDGNWTKLTFWLPTAISIIALASTIYFATHRTVEPSPETQTASVLQGTQNRAVR